MHHRLAFIGFGTVAQGLCEILLEKGDMLKELGLTCEVVAVSDVMKGSVYDENGLDIGKLLEMASKGEDLGNYPTGVKGMDSLTTITDTNADTIVEVTYTDVKTGEPATTHVRAALNAGKNVVSTNKGPTVKHVAELVELAKENGVHYGFEGVVLAGTPVLNLARYTLAGNRITGFKGIMNGTTNYILTRMEEGMPYGDALAKAQELGYAEADQTGDVEGWDALGKVVILSNVVLGKRVGLDDVEREGITGITVEDIESARSAGERWKLIGSAEITPEGKFTASVKPMRLPLSDPLAGVGEAINALTFNTDELGPVTIVGPGAGKRETGFALLIDLLNMD